MIICVVYRPVVPGRGPLAMPLPLTLKRPRPDLATALITPPGIPPNKKRQLIPVSTKNVNESL